MPTGGISLETVKDYLSFNPVLAIGGTWMLKKEWIETERFDLIADACAATVAAVLLARRGKHLAGKSRAV
jgi:2-dehydro-3-deoxyphosphogluconate aldolase/(4S)-4-hydroxy-2-oxoglutarate aldolase